MLANQPALDCLCKRAGVITIANARQTDAEIS